jgi:hypothetical protein
VYQFFSVNQQINHTFKLQTQHLYSDSNHYNKIQSLHAVYNCFVPLSFSLLRGQASGQREKPHSIEGGLGGPGPQVSVPGNATKMERQIISQVKKDKRVYCQIKDAWIGRQWCDKVISRILSFWPEISQKSILYALDYKKTYIYHGFGVMLSASSFTCIISFNPYLSPIKQYHPHFTDDEGT